MSKNVIIAEGSTGRRMPDVSKILTVRPTSGSDLWVSVDERLSRQKYITKNGTFYATDEELYAFSKVTVNVPGGVQGVTTPTITTPISNTSPDAMPDIDPHTGQLNDITVTVETLDQTTSPTAMPQSTGTAGNQIFGIDPTDGNKYVVGVVQNNEIVKSKIPSQISILTPPAKLSYKNGERIQYAGLTIELLDGSGEHFENNDFPIGVLTWGAPYSVNGVDCGVITTLENATYEDPESGQQSDVYIDSDGAKSTIVTFTEPEVYWSQHVYYSTYTVGAGTKVGIPQSSGQNAAYLMARGYYGYYPSYEEAHMMGIFFRPLSTTGHSLLVIGSESGGWATITQVIDSDGWYWTSQSHDISGLPFTEVTPRKGPGSFHSGEVHVPVQWRNPYDGTITSDSFDVSVSKQSDSSSQNGNSGNSGGGGHSF